MGQLQEKYKNYREPQKYMAAGVYPYFREITSKQMTEVTDIDGHNILMFGSNAYQGLTNDQRVIDAAKAALDKYGSGCAGSRFLNGTLDLHVQLEKELAEFMHKDETLCFSTGFSVNQGVLACVVGRNDYIICDDRDHASIVDGRRLSFATQLHYKHNDMEDLERVLKTLPHEAIKLIVVDGVFSMEEGFEIGETESPIIPLYVRDALKTFEVTKKAYDRGVFINPVIPPACAPQDTLVRFALMATHTKEQVERGVQILKEVFVEEGVIK